MNRLNEALIASFGEMSAENLPAVDRVVKIVRELDRYQGGSAARGASTRRKLLESLNSGAEADSCPTRAALERRGAGSCARRNRNAPQPAGKSRFGSRDNTTTTPVVDEDATGAAAKGALISGWTGFLADLAPQGTMAGEGGT